MVAAMLASPSDSRSIETMKRSFMKHELEPFAAVYARRPGGRNMGGAAFFHYFAMWCAIKVLRPTHIIESGCFKGVGSWFLRQAAGNATNMTFISPEKPTVYVDKRPGSRHLFGSAFRDFTDYPWEVWLTPEQRRSTLIFFDDHQSGMRRAVEASRFGFTHAVFDDNYLPGFGDNWALKSFHAQAKGITAPTLWVDNFLKPSPKAWYPQSTRLNTSDLADLRRMYDACVDYYFEFPPVWHGPNRFGIGERAWKRITAHPLLSADGAQAFAKKHALKLDFEAKRYTHIGYARVRFGGAGRL